MIQPTLRRDDGLGRSQGEATPGSRPGLNGPSRSLIAGAIIGSQRAVRRNARILFAADRALDRQDRGDGALVTLT